jgi:hypothetical protein
MPDSTYQLKGEAGAPWCSSRASNRVVAPSVWVEGHVRSVVISPGRRAGRAVGVTVFRPMGCRGDAIVLSKISPASRRIRDSMDQVDQRWRRHGVAPAEAAPGR